MGFHRLVSFVCLGLALACASAAGPAGYDIDPNHFSVGFLVEHVGFARVLGFFREAKGSFTFDEETGEISAVEIVVQTASVFTNQADRDRHLKSADFLNVEEFPEMVFRSNGTELVERKGEMTGELTLLGVSKPLTLTVQWNKSDYSPLGDGLTKPYVTGMSIRGSFRRSEFGMDYGVANILVGDDVELLIEFEAVRQ